MKEAWDRDRSVELEDLRPLLQRYELVAHRNWEAFPSMTAIAQESVK